MGKSIKEYDYLVFKDDFEDLNLDSWRIDLYNQTNEGTWSIIFHEGSNVLSLQGNIDIQPEGISLKNCTVLVKTKFVTYNQPGHISIRITDYSTPRYFIRYDSQDLRLVKNMDSVVELLTVDCILKPDTWYTFKITCVGDRIGVYVNDKLLIDYVDENPILIGGVGLETGVSSHLLFDNFQLLSSYDVYVGFLLEEIEDEINDGREAGYDTSKAEAKLVLAYDAYDNGDYSICEALANEALDFVYVNKIDGSDSSDHSLFYFDWTVQTITGLITIAAALVGVLGWFYRRRLMERRGRILISKRLEEVDDVYSRFRMNSIKCEAELIRLKGEVLREFKEELIDEENFKILDKRIDTYLKEIREDIQKENSNNL